jgi:cytochrome c oxidase subunit 2
LLFAIVPIVVVGVTLYAPLANWGLVPGVSTFVRDIDRMFNVILAITGITFIGTQGVLAYVLFKYSANHGRARYIHTHHKMEVIWTAVPAAILVFIAFYQFSAWTQAKAESSIPADAKANPLAEVLGTQFDWRIRYPGADRQPGKAGVDDDDNGSVDDWSEILFPGSDDFETVNELHFPVDKPQMIRLRSRDVLHSFFLPHFRVKQDAVPGSTIHVWFQSQKEGTFELVCAELCGWGHYRMRGVVTVESVGKFEQWLRDQHQQQGVTK